MKAIKKAQNGAKTADSTSYYSNKAAYLTDRGVKQSKIKDWDGMNRDFDNARKAIDSQLRQSRKGKPGYDKNGFPLKKNKAKSGATIAKDGKWIQKATASIKRRGTEGKCTPITKPGCTGKAKALAKTFKKIAKSNKKN
jgi:hypothetical protein